MSIARCAFILLAGWIAACTNGKDASPAEDAVPKLLVAHTRQPPNLDGSLADPVWGLANTTRAFVETSQRRRRSDASVGQASLG